MKHWAALDITDKRVPTLKPDIIPKHKIETFGIPKKSKVRPLNPEMSKKVKEILLDWEKQGIIRESVGSPYASSIVIVGNKGGSGIRLCVDFRDVNQFTVKDAYPLPNIQASLNQLGKQKYFLP